MRTNNQVVQSVDVTFRLPLNPEFQQNALSQTLMVERARIALYSAVDDEMFRNGYRPVVLAWEPVLRDGEV